METSIVHEPKGAEEIFPAARRRDRSTESGLTVQCEKLSRLEWYDIVRLFEDASIYQTWSWGAVRWGADRLSHMVLRKNGKVISAAQVWVFRFPLFKRGIAFLKWGPMWHLRGGKKDPEIYRMFLEELVEEYAVRRNLLLRIMPNWTDRNEETLSILDEGGFTLSRSPVYRTLLLDLDYSLDELKKSLKRQWRQNVNKGVKTDLRVDEGQDPALVEHFLHLYRQTLSRKKFAEHLKVEDVMKVQGDLPKDLQMRVMVCFSEQTPVSALICSAAGNSAVILFVANSEDSLRLKGSYFLHWRLIERLKADGVRWCDLGGIEADARPGDGGTYRFKAGLAGTLGQNRVYPLYEICRNPFSRIGVGLADQARSMHRRLMESVAG